MKFKDIKNCSRCGGAHDEIDARPFTRTVAPLEAPDVRWTHWALCPTNGEPILIWSEGAEATP